MSAQAGQSTTPRYWPGGSRPIARAIMAVLRVKLRESEAIESASGRKLTSTAHLQR